MEPREASRACGQAADALARAMTKTTHVYALQFLAEGLSAVAGRMEPREAARACGRAAADLARAVATTADPYALLPLAEYLSAAAVRMEPEGAAAVLIQAMSTTTQPDALRRLAQGLSAVLSREAVLPAQALVDLLKHPFCVREARRLVLEQLSRHYHRPFADQWEFVAYAQLHQPQLDLLTPPKHPEPKP